MKCTCRISDGELESIVLFPPAPPNISSHPSARNILNLDANTSKCFDSNYSRRHWSGQSLIWTSLKKKVSWSLKIIWSFLCCLGEIERERKRERFITQWWNLITCRTIKVAGHTKHLTVKSRFWYFNEKSSDVLIYDYWKLKVMKRLNC